MARNKTQPDVLVDPKDQEAEVAGDATADLLTQAAQQLAAAAKARGDRSKLLKEVEATLSQIRITDVPELADSPVVQAFLKAIGVADLTPGEVRNKGTLGEREREWSWETAWTVGKPTTFVAIEDMSITWNGVGPIDIRAGDEVTLPSPFYDIYRERLKAKKQADLNINWLTARSDVPPDRNWITDASAHVRALSATRGPSGQVAGRYAPGAGRINEGEETGGEEVAPSESAVKATQ